MLSIMLAEMRDVNPRKNGVLFNPTEQDDVILGIWSGIGNGKGQ